MRASCHLNAPNRQASALRAELTAGVTSRTPVEED